MKEDGASLVRHRRVGIVPDFDQPAVGKIVVPHFFFCEPGRRIVRVVNRDETVVVRAGRIVDPGVRFRHLVKGEIRPGRERRIVGVNFAKAKNSGGGAAVAFFFAEPAFSLAGEAAAPGEAVFSKEDGRRFIDRLPGSVAGAFEALQHAAHRIPIGGQANDQLLAIVRHSGGTGTAGDEKQPCWQPPKSP